jgi:dihydroxyacetone kinase
MQTKHFVNDPTALVVSALNSFRLINPALSLDVKNKILYAPRKHGQVSIISGGGAGHEPSFMGFVGDGLLTAAVSGTIFASPSSRQVLSAIENVDNSKGILILVMNYTGDVLNFGVAIEKAKAANAALKIEMLIVGDDVSVVRSRAGRVGRRGLSTCRSRLACRRQPPAL